MQLFNIPLNYISQGNTSKSKIKPMQYASVQQISRQIENME